MSLLTLLRPKVATAAPVVTHRLAHTDNADGSSYVSASFSPAAGELLVVFVQATASAVSSGTLVDSAGGTYSKITTATRSGSATTGYLFIANQLASGAAITLTFDCSADPATGCIILAAGVSGMSSLGASASRQSAVQSNQASGTTPAPTFAVAALSANPTLGFVFTGDNPPALTPPTGWTEQADVGHGTPSAGGEYVSRDSGFTGTTITWGSITGASYGDIIVELIPVAVLTIALAGTITPAGALSRATSKPLPGTLTPAGALAKKPAKQLAGATTPAGALALFKAIMRAFAGTITPAGALVKADSKALAASLAPAGSIAKATAKPLAGTVTPAGALAMFKVVIRLFAGTITPAGALAKANSKALAGTVTPAGALRKQEAKTLAGTVTPAATIAKAAGKALVGSLLPTGALQKLARKFLAGLLAPVGALNAILGGTNVKGSVSLEMRSVADVELSLDDD